MTTTADANRRLIRQLWDATDSRKDPAAVERFLAPGYVRHSSEGDYTGEDFARLLAELYRGFPDLSSDVADIVAEGDRVAFRWVSVGTHLETYMGVPATHKRITATGITISRIEDGLIAEDWASWNKVNVLYDLGIIPLGRS
jgi:steroid delta-isomerase-like uncharacterized protein